MSANESLYYHGSHGHLKKWLRYESPSTTPLDAFLIKILELEKDELVLDDGAGNGRFSIAMAREGASVIALDINKVLISEAVKRIKQEGYSRKIEPVLGDIQKLPFRGGVFSKVLCAHNLWYVPDYKGSISEVFRVTKVSGIVIIDHLNILNPVILVSMIFREVANIMKKMAPVFYRTPNQILLPFTPYPTRIFSIKSIFSLLFRPAFHLVEGKRSLAYMLIIISKKALKALLPKTKKSS